MLMAQSCSPPQDSSDVVDVDVSVPSDESEREDSGYVPRSSVVLMPDGNLEDYARSLDLETGVARVEWRVGTCRFTREVFASAADQALVVRLTASEPDKLEIHARLSRPTEDGMPGPTVTSTTTGQLRLEGEATQSAGGVVSVCVCVCVCVCAWVRVCVTVCA